MKCVIFNVFRIRPRGTFFLKKRVVFYFIKYYSDLIFLHVTKNVKVIGVTSLIYKNYNTCKKKISTCKKKKKRNKYVNSQLNSFHACLCPHILIFLCLAPNYPFKIVKQPKISKKIKYACPCISVE